MTNANWELDTPLIDLTGGSPGALAIVGGHIVGTPRLLGGYSGPDDFAIAVMTDSEKETIDTAWIITTSNGSRRIDPTVLSVVGLDFPRGYEKVGTIEFRGHRNETQEFWRRKTEYVDPSRI